MIRVGNCFDIQEFIWYRDNEAKCSFLTWIMYKYAQKLKATKVKKNNGNLYWSKHYSIKEAFENGDTGWLNQMTDRTTLPNEIVLDFDDEGRYKRNAPLFAKTDLERRNINFIGYTTGGKGIHIHIYYNELLRLPLYQRIKKKKQIILHYSAEMLKASENVMILMENSPNRKTGILKKEVFRNVI